MSEPENFLVRWSRLKREGGAPADQEPSGGDDAASSAEQTGSTAPAESGEAAPSSADAATNPPTFDPASLPSIESITAATDIRPFLGPGVPAALTRAALRRAWVSDPKIRDFIEMAENQWDFTNPDSIPGFATFQPGEDVAKFVAQVSDKIEAWAEKSPETPPAGAIATGPAPESRQSLEFCDEPPAEQVSATAPADGELPQPPGSDPVNVASQSNSDVAATQQDRPQSHHAALPTRRSRGGTLPQ